MPNPSTNTYQVIECCYISRIWYALLTVGLIGMMGGFIGYEQANPSIAVVSFLVVIVSILLVTVLFIGLMNLDSPVKELYRTGENTREFVPIASLLLGMLPPFFGVLFLEEFLQVGAFAVIVVEVVGYDRYRSRIAEASFVWQRKLMQRTKQFPLIAANYVALILSACLVLVMFRFTYRSPLFLDLLAVLPTAAPLVFSLFELTLIGIFVVVLRDAWASETKRFQRSGRNITSRRSILTTVIVVVVVSFVFSLLSLRVIQGATWLAQRHGSPGVYWYLSVTLLPIGFIGMGLCYQVASVGSNLLQLRQKSRREDLSGILDVDADTYVLDHDGLFAGAVGLFDEYILVSRRVLDELDEEEVAAVLAHEEGHLEHGEARLTLLIALLSPLVFTGKNILYGVLDFRRREYRADEYAVSRINDRDQVLEALDSLQEAKTDALDEQFSGVTPTLVPMDADEEATTLVTQIFGFYFGNFAFSQAHPDLDERKANLAS